MIFKNKTLPWKTPKPNFVAFFLLIEMAFLSNLAQTFRKPGRHVVTSVCSHASQEYPGIFLDREPMRACEKHYSLVWYMLMTDIEQLFTEVEVTFFRHTVRGQGR